MEDLVSLPLIQFPVQTKLGRTAAGVQRQLVPWGCYLGRREDAVCLDLVTAVLQYNNWPDGVPDLSSWVLPVTVIFSDGRAPPTTYGIDPSLLPNPEFQRPALIDALRCTVPHAKGETFIIIRFSPSPIPSIPPSWEVMDPFSTFKLGDRFLAFCVRKCKVQWDEYNTAAPENDRWLSEQQYQLLFLGGGAAGTAAARRPSAEGEDAPPPLIPLLVNAPRDEVPAALALALRPFLKKQPAAGEPLPIPAADMQARGRGSCYDRTRLQRVKVTLDAASLQLYDFTRMSEPLVNAVSAPAEKVAAATEARKAWQELHDAAEPHAKTFKDVINNLAAMATCYNPKNNPAYSHCKPSAYVKLHLEPAPGDGTGRLATLHIQVLVCTQMELNHTPATWNGSSTISMARAGHDPGGSIPTSLTHAMECVLRTSNAPGFQDMNSEVERVRLIQPTRSLVGLVQALETVERPPAQQPAGLTVQLRPYQLQSLAFMLEQEARPGGFRDLLWVKVPRPGVVQWPGGGNTWRGRAPQRLWYSPVLQALRADVAPMPCGGFLAEEMGLGKTVEVLALVLASPAPPLEQLPSPPSGTVNSRATLVVCPVSLVGQWCSEATAKSDGSLRIYQYHGSSRIRDVNKLAKEYDIVVTTYQTLGKDAGTNSKNVLSPHPLARINWYRVVLDEGHTVKSTASIMSKACYSLHSNRRWLASGTPINNAVDDLLGQFMFLKLAPWDAKRVFGGMAKTAFGGNGCWFRGDTTPLLYTLLRTTVRHTKTQVLGGEAVLSLPPKTEALVPVHLNPTERDLYLRTYSEINSLLQPLRQICSGGLVREADLSMEAGRHNKCNAHHAQQQQQASGALGGGSGPECPSDDCSICLEIPMEEPHRTPCGHFFCRECILGAISSNPACPLCRQALEATSLVRARPASSLVAAEASENNAAAAGQEGASSGTECDSKLKALIRELHAMKDSDGSCKALIFSQFGSTLEWLQKKLPEEGFGFRTITGSMSLSKRKEAINAFQGDPPTTVFLLSVRSGAVGINLTAASHVFLLEPCLNPALEEQAVGRAWRMGQTRPVAVKKFYVPGSVEENIVEMVRARQHGTDQGAGGGSASGSTAADAATAAGNGAGASSSSAPAAGGSSSNDDGPAVQALAGNLRTDKQALKVQEVEQLFSQPKLQAEDATGDAGQQAVPLAVRDTNARGG